MHKNLIDSIKKFQLTVNKSNIEQNNILHIKDELVSKIQSFISKKNNNFTDNNDIQLLFNQFSIQLENSVINWNNKINDTLPMKKLSETFEDKIIFLVFGKVNAGKSSFANYISQIFKPDEIKFFRFLNNSIEYFDGPFKEGATETTAQIQGVEIGGHFVLLDSPGLHSVTSENEQLTRTFTDSADAVLWLTSSSSPGQLQELEDLKQEIERNKPLLPIITRSDIKKDTDEWCDTTNQPIQITINKSLSTRKGQEEDIFSRLKDFNSFKIQELKQPISISIHCFNQSNKDEIAYVESGLSLLSENLVNLISKAEVYKKTKYKQQIINFLNSNVKKTIDEDFYPSIKIIEEKIQNTIDNLESNKNYFSLEIITNIQSNIVLIVEKHKKNKDLESITKEINSLIVSSIDNKLSDELSDLFKTIENSSINLNSNSIGKFEEMKIKYQVVKGTLGKTISELGGGLAGAYGGAALGTTIFPGVGTAIGAFIGGLLGGFLSEKAGKKIFIEKETREEVVDISSSNVITEITNFVNKEIPKQIEFSINQVIKQVAAEQKKCQEIILIIDNFNSNINKLESNIKK